MKKGKHANPLETSYPNLAYFLRAIGWIEVGHDEDSLFTSFVRAMDAGGMVWEGKDEYRTLDEAFRDMDKALGKWMRKQRIQVPEK